MPVDGRVLAETVAQGDIHLSATPCHEQRVGDRVSVDGTGIVPDIRRKPAEHRQGIDCRGEFDRLLQPDFRKQSA
jgi:hypothetical protein